MSNWQSSMNTHLVGRGKSSILGLILTILNQFNIGQYQTYTLILGHKTLLFINEQLSPSKLEGFMGILKYY